MNKRFWMVWNSNGRAPTHPHLTEGEALKEAERLANVSYNTGDVFYVLEASHRVEIAPRPVQTTELSTDPYTDEERKNIEVGDSIPF